MDYRKEWEQLLQELQQRYPEVHAKSGDFSQHVILFYSTENKTWKIQYRDERTIPYRIRKELYDGMRKLLGF